MPSQRFYLQVWDKDAKLATNWLPLAHDLVEAEELNTEHTLKFKYPMYDSRSSDISFRKIVRLIDAEKGFFATSCVDVDADNNAIHVADSSKFAVGDYVLIYDSPTAPTKSFVAKITAMLSGRLTLSRMDFTPTAGTITGGRTYAEIEGDAYADWVGSGYTDILGDTSLASTGSLVIKWTGTTFRVWDVRDSRGTDGAPIREVICNHISYDLNDTRFVVDSRTDITFGLASTQSVTDRLITPTRIVDEVVKTQTTTASDFSNGWIKGDISSELTTLQETTYTGDISISTATRTVTGTGTTFMSDIRQGTRLYTAILGTLNAIVDHVVSDTELLLKSLPRFSTTSAVAQTDPDSRTFEFDTNGSLRSAVVKIAEVWRDDTQDIHLTYGEDKSINVARVDIPNASDPTGDMEVRLGKNLQSSSRKLDVADFGNSVMATGSTSGWQGAQTDQNFTIGGNPSTLAVHRNTRDKFRLETPTDIRQLRWGDPLTILHQPMNVNVTGWTNDSELLVSFAGALPTISSALGDTPGWLTPGDTYYFRVAPIDADGKEGPASLEATETLAAGEKSVAVTYSGSGSSYRVYFSQTSGEYTDYFTDAASPFQLTTEGGAKKGSPKDFDATSYTNGVILVRDYDSSGAGSAVDIDSGAGQMRTIEAMVKVGHVSNTDESSLFYRVRTTSPWDVLPSTHFDVVVCKGSDTFMTPITGFGVFQKRLPSDGSYSSQEPHATTETGSEGRRFHARLSDTGVGYQSSTHGHGFDVFKDHYTGGLIQLRDSRGTSAAAGGELRDDTQLTGQQRPILSNGKGSQSESNASQADMVVKFENPGTLNNLLPHYEMTGPPQLVREFDDADFEITTQIVTSPENALKITVVGAEKTRTGTVTYISSASQKYAQDGGSELDYSVVEVGDELYADNGGEFLIGSVGMVDIANKRLWLDGGFINGKNTGGTLDEHTPSTNVPLVVRKPRPNFNHESGQGNMFHTLLHRDSDGDGAVPDSIQGHCYIAEADYTDSGGTTAAWGTGAESDVGGVKEGVGHVLEVATDSANENQLYLLWDGAATTTHTEIILKRIILVRPNSFTWVSTLQSPFKYAEGDVAVLMLAETGGPLTIGKRIAGQSWVYGVTGDLSEDHEYGGITGTAVPIQAGHHTKFEAGSTVFIGSQAANTSIEFATRRGDARLGQVRRIESVVVGADQSPTRPFDILNLTTRLDTLPQPGDRVEMLTIQDQTSITTYGRVERPAEHTDIVRPEELYRLARQDLRLRKDPIPRYEVSVLDLEFMNPNSRYEFDEAVVGNTYRLIDVDYSLDRTDFKLVKIERDYENPLKTRMQFNHHEKTLARGFMLSTELRLRKAETTREQARYAQDSPKCMYFDTVTRRCRKVKPPNAFCNTDTSNRDGRLRRDNARMTGNDCRNFTPPDNASIKFYSQMDSQSFTLGSGSTELSVDLDVLVNPDPGSTGMLWDIEDKPVPVAFITDAYYLDQYSNKTFVSPGDLTATLTKDADGEFTPNDAFFNTGARVTIARAGSFDSGEALTIMGTVLVLLPGSRA